MSDFYLSLQYFGPGKIERIGQGLRSNPSDTVPGWFVRAYTDEGYTDFVKYTRVPWSAALPAIQDLGNGLNDPAAYGALQAAACAAERQHVNDLEKLRIQHETQIEQSKRFLEEAGFTVKEGSA